MSKVISKKRWGLTELTNHQLRILIEDQRKEMKEIYHDNIARMIARNKLLRLEKEFERRNLPQEKNIQN